MTPPPPRVVVRGRGRVELAAHGVADAEHRIEKELAALWPEGTVTVTEVTRSGAGRIVEEFAVGYALRGVMEPAADAPGDAPRAALRELRARFEGTRYARVAWEVERE